MSMEPNFWLDLGVWGAGMMSSHNSHPKPEDEVTFGQLVRRWGHLGTTVTIAIFLFLQWQGSGKEREEMTKQIAVNTSVIAHLIQENRDQDAITKGNIDALSHRLDLQRADLSTLQQDFFMHERGAFSLRHTVVMVDIESAILQECLAACREDHLVVRFLDRIWPKYGHIE